MPLADTFNMAPDEAIKWFERKGYEIGWDWFDVWQREHSKAFTVAKAMSYDILRDIRGALDDAMQQGLTGRKFRQFLTAKLKARGWWGRVYQPNPKTGKLDLVQLGSPWRLNTIYQTNMQASYMAGRWRQFYENRRSRPYLQYIAVLDPVTRDSHAALHGKIFHINDPIWQRIYPPNGFNCRCRVRALTEKQAIQRGYKKGSKFDLPDKFPDLGFSHNHGIGQVANDIKEWKSWHALREIKNQHLLNQLQKQKARDLINLGVFASFIDGEKGKGNRAVAGFIDNKTYDEFNPKSKHGAVIVPDHIAGKGISDFDWKLLPFYLIRSKTVSVEGNKLIIMFKQQRGDQTIKLTIGSDMVIVKAEYLNEN